MQFTWDESKNRANKHKHGISFETAILVFEDPYHLSVQDREVDREPRWQTIGLVKGMLLVLVAHTVEDTDESEETIRIISARKATSQERRIYAEGT